MSFMSLELDAKSLEQLAAFESELLRIEKALYIETEAELALFAEVLKEAWAKEFKAGTNSKGQSHDAPGWNKTGRTLGSLELRVMGRSATIKMGYGAVYVEYAQPPHWIEAKPGHYLHWQEETGIGVIEDHYAKKVWHPGWKGDDFVGRAVRDVELTGAFVKAFERWGLAQFSFGPKGVLNYELLR